MTRSVLCSINGIVGAKDIIRSKRPIRVQMLAMLCGWSIGFIILLGVLSHQTLHAEFENVIEIDRDRNVVFDFGV